MLKFCVLKVKLVSILYPKKPEQTMLSLIILSMSNVSHERDNPTPNCMFCKFLWQGQFRHYTTLIYNNLCPGEQWKSEQSYIELF
jgi:hypothetical protein